jgi:CDP-diacylglycerol--glycerol-3-phosphate 3-phosphatidyltransferase
MPAPVNIPTGLTLARVAAIPLLIVAFYLPGDLSHTVSAILFALASITDWLDGYLARRWKQTSSFGAFLDPVADKVLVAVALILLLQADPRVLLAVPMAIIIGREITISALREWMAMLGERTSVAVTQVAKFKTTFQMIAIAFMLWQHPEFGAPIYEIGVALLLIAAALTIWTMAMYLKAAWPILRKGMTPGS